MWNFLQNRKIKYFTKELPGKVPLSIITCIYIGFKMQRKLSIVNRLNNSSLGFIDHCVNRRKTVSTDINFEAARGPVVLETNFIYFNQLKYFNNCYLFIFHFMFTGRNLSNALTNNKIYVDYKIGRGAGILILKSHIQGALISFGQIVQVQLTK